MPEAITYFQGWVVELPVLAFEHKDDGPTGEFVFQTGRIGKAGGVEQVPVFEAGEECGEKRV